MQGGGETPTCLSARFVAATWWMCSFLIVFAYVAYLASYLMMERERSNGMYVMYLMMERERSNGMYVMYLMMEKEILAYCVRLRY